MIKYNLNNINDWYFDTSDIIKVYRNNSVCYYKIITSGGTSGQTPCFAVVEDISQYSDTEFEDVFNNADGLWYKLNNLNQYEQYGIYGSGRTITYYDGKLTIDDGYEYMYSGGSWVNVGEISGGTTSLPNVPFSVNYNAKNYNSQTKTLAKTSGQLVDVDAVITAGTPTVNDNYLTISYGTRATISGYQTYFNRDNSNPNLTIISKQNTSGSYCHMFANRDGNYNWMYRCYSNKLTLHGSGEIGGVAVTTQPVVESVRVDSSRNITYNNYTNNTTSGTTGFSYGATNSGKFALFAGYGTSTGEYFAGDFYWVYMSQNTLTDEQVQQVIDYNEGGGGQPIYPLEYVVIEDPPDNIVFSSMAEAEEYECPWVGMKATIDGDRYIFSGDSQSGYEWVYNPSKDSDFVIGDFTEFVSSSTEVTEGYYIIYSYAYDSSYADKNYLFSWNSGNTWSGYYTLGNMNHTDLDYSVPISSSEIIDDAVWELKSDGNGNFYIRNVGKNLYWYYLGTNASYGVPLTDNANDAIPVNIQNWRDCLAFVEKYNSSNYALNKLYGYPYRYGWFGSLASDDNNQYYMRKYVP